MLNVLWYWVLPLSIFMALVDSDVKNPRTSINLHTYICTWYINIYVCVCVFAAATAKSLQPCPTLCNPIDSSPPGSPVPGILQARTLE